MQEFDTTTNYLAQWGAGGSGNSQFSRPEALATDAVGNVYVVDRDNHHIRKFLPSATFLLAWGSNDGGNGQFDRPTGIAVDGAGKL